MTEEEIEIAARRLCKIRGIDPNAYLDPRGTERAWESALHEIKACLDVGQAISYVDYVTRLAD